MMISVQLTIINNTLISNANVLAVSFPVVLERNTNNTIGNGIESKYSNITYDEIRFTTNKNKLNSHINENNNNDTNNHIYTAYMGSNNTIKHKVTTICLLPVASKFNGVKFDNDMKSSGVRNNNVKDNANGKDESIYFTSQLSLVLINISIINM